MLPGHKIHNCVACNVEGISTARSATILQNKEGCEKIDSENITQLSVELKNC